MEIFYQSSNQLEEFPKEPNRGGTQHPDNGDGWKLLQKFNQQLIFRDLKRFLLPLSTVTAVTTARDS